MLFITAIAILGGLALLLATFLVIARVKLAVDEDPRIDQVESMLPHADCGACGFPGCRAFAQALVNGEAAPAQCTVSATEALVKIAETLNVSVGSQEKRVARLACAGGTNVARVRAHYTGTASCQAAAGVAGGGKSCAWGCLGFGDCEKACDFNAIHMNEHNLPVVDETLCTACGDCVVACPKDLFSLHPANHRLWVACNNLDAGDVILDHCEVACTACGRCAMDAPNHLIIMQNNLPVINYTAAYDGQRPIQRCPTGAIVWLNEDGTVIKGVAHKTIIRREALPAATS